MRLLFLLFCFVVIAFPGSTFAYTQIDIKEKIKVYRKPRLNYRPFAELNSGSVAQIIKTGSQTFYKIRFTFNGRKVFGYIKKEDIFESEILEEGKTISNKSIQAFVASDFMYQSETKITTQSSSEYTVDAASSLAPVFGALISFPVKDPFVVEIFVQLKNSAFEKTFKDKSSILAPTTSKIKQSFFGGGFMIKYRFDKWLVGGGLEFDSGQSVEIETISGTPIETDQTSKPLFIQPAMIFERPFLWGDFPLSFKIRSGVIVNTKPVIATLALQLAFGVSL